VRVVGADGELIGVMPTPKAMELAQERDLDLVEVAPRSRPPVCRIMDYGKYKYELSKRAKKAKSRQHQIQMKEMRLRPKIEEHDYEFKAKKVRGFLGERNKVRVTVIFRGREMTHPERGERILKPLVEHMSAVGVQAGPIRREGRNMVLMLIPKSTGGAKPASGKTGEKPSAPSAPKAAPKGAPKAAPKEAPKPAPTAAPKEVPKPAPTAAPKEVPKPAPTGAPKEVPKPPANEEGAADAAGAEKPSS